MKTLKKDRGQMHTLEGITAATVVIMAAFFMTQSLAITPTSSSTASKAAQGEMQQLGEDLLSQAHSNGDLKEAILYWDDGSNKYHNSTAVSFRGQPPDPDNLDFGRSLKNLFDDRGVAYNIEFRWARPNTTRVSSSFTYVDNGDPTDNSVVATQKVVLRHNDTIHSGEELTNNEGNSSTGTFPVKGFTKDNGEYRPGMYNIVEVQLTIWQK